MCVCAAYARMLCDVLDDAIQLHGSLGYSEDMPDGQGGLCLWWSAG